MKSVVDQELVRRGIPDYIMLNAPARIYNTIDLLICRLTIHLFGNEISKIFAFQLQASGALLLEVACFCRPIEPNASSAAQVLY
jgi:hypothetical protein